MDINIKNLRELLAATVGEDLKAEGFSIDKTQTWIKKIVNKKSKIRFFIDCYKYTTRLEFRLIISFWIHEVIQEKDKYYQYLGLPFDTKNQLYTFSEGDFTPIVKDLELKFRGGFTHKVTDITDTEIAINKCRQTLQKEILPILDTFSILEDFQKYVLESYKYPQIFCSATDGIIAMKLKGMEELELLVNYFWESEHLEQKPKDHFFRRVVENIIPYSKSCK
ncbi:MAG: hypothetical protein V4685_17815 [Bacteroidota bacterium]